MHERVYKSGEFADNAGVYRCNLFKGVNIMKKAFLVIVLIFSFLPIFSLEIKASIDADNYAFKKDATRKGKVPYFGFTFDLEDEINNYLKASLSIKRTAGFGNKIGARLTYFTEYMNISFGPTFSVFNLKFSKDNFLKLFQPGIGIAMSFDIPAGFFASIDTNFAFPLIKGDYKPIYLQDGEFEIGWVFPNLRASAKVKQNAQTIVENDVFIYVTDIGLHTVAYSKPSRIRIPINVIYRMSQYKKTGATPAKDGIAHVVVETGIIHSVNTDIEWFAKFGASVYSYNMETKDYLKELFYQASVGFSIAINK